MLDVIQQNFAMVRHVKPAASRAEFGRKLCFGDWVSWP